MTFIQIENEHMPKILFNSLIKERTSKILQSIQKTIQRAETYIGN
jgi:hypothetical protein